MGSFQNVITIVGLILILGLLFLLFCRYLGGWTKTRSWFLSSREEKMVLTRGGLGQFNANGYMVPSDSDLNLTGDGSFRRFVKTDNNYTMLQQGSPGSGRQSNIPPQPLRPAPIPEMIGSNTNSEGPFPSSSNPPPKIPPPPQTSRNVFTLSSTNPFLPLIQASTQFISQTITNFQGQQSGSSGGPVVSEFSESNKSSLFYPNSSPENLMNQQQVSSFPRRSSSGGISMGEILFSAPPTYPVPEVHQSRNEKFYEEPRAEPLSQLPVVSRQTPIQSNSTSQSYSFLQDSSTMRNNSENSNNQSIPVEVDLLMHDEIEKPKRVEEHDLETELISTKSLVETMREEIRIENQKMKDATKSLMEDRDESLDEKFFGIEKGVKLQDLDQSICPNKLPDPVNKKISNTTINPSQDEGTSLEKRQEVQIPFEKHFGKSERKFSAPEIKSLDRTFVGHPTSVQQVLLNQPNSISGNVDSKLTQLNEVLCNPVSTASYRHRSFSLRQASTDSIGDSSDLGSPEASTLPFLQRAMSCDSVCSDTSVVLGDLDAPHTTGFLCVGLEYDSETADLMVNVIEGKELVGLDPDPGAPFDSYVRVYLLPDKTTNMQTRVYRKSLSPVYKEKFMFGLEVAEIPSRSLVFYLYATNKFSNTLIGEAELKLCELDIGQPKITWLPLTDTGQRGGELGEIMFSLSYLPTAERLTVVVVKARNLKFPHQRDTGDPFVKVYLLQKGKKVSKKKSSTKRAEKNPIFNEAMIFSVPTHALQTIQLRITVSDNSEMEGRAYSIGHVIVGSTGTGKALSHWNQMLSSLRKPIAMWHSLRK